MPLPFIAYILGAVGIAGAAKLYKTVKKTKQAKKELSLANKIVSDNNTIISSEKSFATGILSLINKETPKTKIILIIFEPNILPKTNSNSFLFAARNEVTNSGKEVPKAIAVAPMTNSEILKNLAIEIEPSTKEYDPIDKAIIPITKYIINELKSRSILESS